MIEIKIDKETLPKDGQRVRFRTYSPIEYFVEWYEGVFIESEDIFYVDEEDYFFSRQIWKWELID